MNDRDVVCALTGLDYDELREQLIVLAAEADPFVSRIDQTWRVLPSQDAWMLLRRNLSVDDLDRFEEAVHTVLEERDPALDLERSKRVYAGVTGKTRNYSNDLRNGIAMSLAMLGVHGGEVNTGSGTNAEGRVSILIRKMLRNANEDAFCNVWSSLADLLPVFAEAAPDEFLNGVRNGLTGTPPLLLGLFQDQPDDGLFAPHSPHTELLSALETLAWSPLYFGQAVDLLARLSMIDPLDPEGRLRSRPFNSLIDIFCSWHPETQVNVEGRLSAIDGMRKRQRSVSWRLIMNLLPTGDGVHHPTKEPEFRDWTPVRSAITVGEYAFFTSEIVRRLISDAGLNSELWAEIVDRVSQLPVKNRQVISDRLAELVIQHSIDDANALLWEALRSMVAHQRKFTDAVWAIDFDEVDDFENIASWLTPVDPLKRGAWLFAQQMPDLGYPKLRDNHEKYEITLRKCRRKAILSILANQDFDKLKQLAAASAVPYVVGVAVADAEIDDYQCELLGLIDTENHGEVALALGFFSQRFSIKGWDWLKDFLSKSSGVTANQIAQILLCTGDFPMAWESARIFGTEVETRFWQLFSPMHLGGQFSDVVFVVQKLLEVGRFVAALTLLSLYRSRPDLPGEIVAELIAEALDGLALAPTADPDMAHFDHHRFKEIFDFLNTHQNLLEKDPVARLEWTYLPLLGFDPPVNTLQQLLADDPSFFVEVVSTLYRPASEVANDALDSEDRQIRAGLARMLLSSWTKVPGTDVEGAFSSDELRAWIEEARTKLEQVDRLQIGDYHIGEVLASSLADPDGTWPSEVIRDLLEELQNDSTENGLCVKVLNKRGGTVRGLTDGGDQERSLIAKYHGEAAMFNDRWPRTAMILRRIASSYKEEARRNDQSAERFRLGLYP